ncbi:MAG: hypothetical protein Q8880_07410 [Bacteroidota bacterium]|nr:hypothetical protein [Bacteroidota bacterium]
MSQKKKNINKKTIQTKVPVKPIKPILPRSVFFPFMDYKIEAIFLIVLSFVIYINSYWGGYVLDDVISITNNKFVQQGFGGIGKIFSTDSMFGFVGSANDLQGGRYRPFPLLIFAIEHELWGNSPHLSHLVNIIVWVITCFIVFNFLRKYLFRNKPDIAFIAALIFIVHPIHTEVVANIKSRDEIFSLLFLISSVTLLFKYISSQKGNILIYTGSLFLYFIALFSKEYGLTFIFIIPLMIHFFTDIDLKRNIKLVIPFAAVFVFYLMIRFSIVGLNNQVSKELLNNPFLYATGETRFFTIMVCLLKYIRLLFFPFPQSYDYTFNQIPLVGISDPVALFSFFLYAGMFGFAIWKIKSKNVIAFSILFFMISIFVVSNLLIDIGALMGERFLFQPSLGFAIFAGYIIYFIFVNIKGPQILKTTLLSVILIGIIVAGSYRTYIRNNDWKTEYGLYLKDVKVSSNSAIANNYAGVAIINYTDAVKNLPDKNELLTKSVEFCRKASTIYKGYYDAYINSAIALIRLGKLEDAEKEIGKLKEANSAHPRLNEMNTYLASEYNNKAVKEVNKKHLDKAIYYFEKAAETNPANARYWYDLGGASYTNKNYKKAYEAWTKCVKVKPDYIEAINGLRALKGMGL